MHFDRMFNGMLAGFALFLISYPPFFRKKPRKKKLFIGALFIYAGALAFLTMLFVPPWDWNISVDSTWWAISRINLEPVESSLTIYRNCESIGNFRDFYILIGGNLAMLMPLGILTSLLNPRFKFFGITLLAILVSGGIEALQLIGNILIGTPYRTVEIDDVILNVAGCILAYLLFAAIRGVIRFFRGKSRG